MKRGFSVLELLVSVACLVVISGGLFAIFEMCSSNFRLGMTRSALQSQLTSFSTRFGIDARQCSIYAAYANDRTVTVDLDPGVSAQTVNVRRDSLCLSALKDPNDPNSYEAGTGLAKWDCYWIYTATPENPTGQLVRFRRDRVPDTTQSVCSGFPGAASPYFTIPSTLAAPGTSHTIGRGLYKFEASVDVANQQILVRIGFRGEQGHTTAGKRSLAEVAETYFRVKPENSWPRM
jgi:hypothetical protein